MAGFPKIRAKDILDRQEKQCYIDFDKTFIKTKRRCEMYIILA